MTDGIDFDSPEVKQAIADQAAKLTEQKVQEALTGYVPASEVEGLKSKNSELLGKLQDYKGFDKIQMEGYRNYLKELENNEEMRLISEGKHDEVIQRRMAGREKAWTETQAEYEQRLTASQEKADSFSAELDSLKQKNIDMQKRQYFKDLTLGDDSFKKDYFGDFFELQSKFADIDESTGAVYALDEQGKRRVDTDGNLVKFDDYYSKLKVTKGLFWNTGSGSGVPGGSGGDMLGGDPSKWSQEQKHAYIQKNGREAYAKMLGASKK